MRLSDALPPFGDAGQAGEPEPARHRKPQLVVMRKDRDRGYVLLLTERAGAAVRHGQHGRGVQD
jgi:hypothetical protein